MEVTKVFFHHKDEKQPSFIIANVSVIFDDSLAINDMRLATKKEGEGYSLMFPKYGEMRRFYYFPFNRELRETIEKAVISRYEQIKAEGRWREAAPAVEQEERMM